MRLSEPCDKHNHIAMALLQLWLFASLIIRLCSSQVCACVLLCRIFLFRLLDLRGSSINRSKRQREIVRCGIVSDFLQWSPCIPMYMRYDRLYCMYLIVCMCMRVSVYVFHFIVAASISLYWSHYLCLSLPIWAAYFNLREIAVLSVYVVLCTRRSRTGISREYRCVSKCLCTLLNANS